MKPTRRCECEGFLGQCKVCRDVTKSLAKPMKSDRLRDSIIGMQIGEEKYEVPFPVGADCETVINTVKLIKDIIDRRGGRLADVEIYTKPSSIKSKRRKG